jgi:hypothetical protein
MKHTSHRMHTNSVACWSDLDTSERARLVLSVYQNSSVPLTDRECAERLGFKDMNAVRPRCTELRDALILVECGKAKDHISGKTVRTMCVAAPIQMTLADVI